MNEQSGLLYCDKRGDVDDDKSNGINKKTTSASESAATSAKATTPASAPAPAPGKTYRRQRVLVEGVVSLAPLVEN